MASWQKHTDPAHRPLPHYPRGHGSHSRRAKNVAKREQAEKLAVVEPLLKKIVADIKRRRGGRQDHQLRTRNSRTAPVVPYNPRDDWEGAVARQEITRSGSVYKFKILSKNSREIRISPQKDGVPLFNAVFFISISNKVMISNLPRNKETSFDLHLRRQWATALGGLVGLVTPIKRILKV